MMYLKKHVRQIHDSVGLDIVCHVGYRDAILSNGLQIFAKAFSVADMSPVVCILGFSRNSCSV